MKRLFNLCLSAVCFLSITSCSKYYISTLSSTNALKDEQTGQFNIENDSVQVTYSFAGENAPVKITVKNKLQVPLYVDWAKSSLIFEEKSTSYVPDKIAFNGDLSLDTWRQSNITGTDGEIKGEIATPNPTSFIPPNSKVESKTIFLKSAAFIALPDTTFKKTEQVASHQGRVKVHSVNFTRENSPVFFRSYLTLYTESETGKKAFALDNEFYISRSIRSYVSPNNLVDYNGGNFSDVFYTKRTTTHGNIITGVGVLGIVSAGAAVESTNTDNRKR
ncbi:MAG: hypothetical protein WKF66_08055 [Pedobacter sp.]